MASLSIVFVVFAFLFSQLASATKPISSFSLKRFDQNLHFGSYISLYGDAKVVDGGYSVELNRGTNSSAGRLIYRSPIKLNPKISFSTYFSFSISPEKGDGFAFVFLPNGFAFNLFDGGSFGLSLKKGEKVLVVEFGTKMDVNHVGIDVGGLVSVRARNVSFAMNNGEKLQSWISYDVSSKRLEVRLSKFGSGKPHEPLVSCLIDLYEMWKEEEVFVGMSSSSSGNSTQFTTVYSWSFWLRRVPTWLHSQPLDPYAHDYTDEEKLAPVQGRSVCVFRIITVIVFGIGCGALAVFIVLFVKAMFATRHTVVVPVEYPVHPVEFEYKKFKVVVKNAIKDEGK